MRDIRTQIRGCPDAYSLILRRRGDVRLRKDRWRPCNVAHPVCVTGQNLCVLPAPCFCAELPKLDLAVATTSHESSRCASLIAASTDDLTRRNSRCPRNTVYAGATSLKDLICPAVVLELEDRNVAVR